MDAAAADTTTGHNIRTSHATVARALGCSVDTVRRARRVLRRPGILPSRVLRQLHDRWRSAKLLPASTAPGSAGSPSTRCLTIPQQLAYACRVNFYRQPLLDVPSTLARPVQAKSGQRTRR
ncbi:hypothetical protein QJS66_23755 (plasmid) [Kocuria rhizophila]|nr:hypothetical protein QJS66_23755 [Kocuria rhizophila]